MLPDDPPAASDRFTLVSFHAHPDDEVLFTGGTLARASADGHRVVLVVATDGSAGLAEGALLPGLGERRSQELRQSAEALGCARVVRLGYADSGWGSSVRAGGFSQVAVEQAAGRLADVLREESADVLTIYDDAGGYGHPDHIQVHRVGVRAAELAGTLIVLEATLDRRLIQRAVRLVSWLPGLHVRAADFRTAYTASGRITHEVDVRPHCAAKRRAMQAHVSQAGGGGVRTLALLLHLPGPLYRLVLGREWFVERGRAAGPRSDDVFSALRPRSGAAHG